VSRTALTAINLAACGVASSARAETRGGDAGQISARASTQEQQIQCLVPRPFLGRASRLQEAKSMNRKPRPQKRNVLPIDPAVQQGNDRSIVKDERLKRVIKQHPQRDEPKVDGVEPDDVPAA
jgi:hypothetical protein